VSLIPAADVTKNRDRLLNHEIARNFFLRVVERAKGLMSDEHFTVDGIRRLSRDLPSGRVFAQNGEQRVTEPN